MTAETSTQTVRTTLRSEAHARPIETRPLDLDRGARSSRSDVDVIGLRIMIPCNSRMLQFCGAPGRLLSQKRRGGRCGFDPDDDVDRARNVRRPATVRPPRSGGRAIGSGARAPAATGWICRFGSSTNCHQCNRVTCECVAFAGNDDHLRRCAGSQPGRGRVRSRSSHIRSRRVCCRCRLLAARSRGRSCRSR